MIAKEPADRYQTPADVIEALLPWVPAESIDAMNYELRRSGDSSVRRAAPPKKSRRRKMMAAVAGVALLAGVATAVAVWPDAESTAGPTPARPAPPPNRPAIRPSSRRSKRRASRRRWRSRSKPRSSRATRSSAST